MLKARMVKMLRTAAIAGGFALAGLFPGDGSAGGGVIVWYNDFDNTTSTLNVTIPQPCNSNDQNGSGNGNNGNSQNSNDQNGSGNGNNGKNCH